MYIIYICHLKIKADQIKNVKDEGVLICHISNLIQERVFILVKLIRQQTHGKGLATGHGLWTSDNDTSVTIRGTWKENNPVDVEIVSAQGVTTKYNAERYKRLHPESRMSLMSDYGISDDAAIYDKNV